MYGGFSSALWNDMRCSLANDMKRAAESHHQVDACKTVSN